MSNCPKCGIRILGDSTKCRICDKANYYAPSNPSGGSKKGLSKTGSSSGMGCGILVVIAIIVGFGFGLKSCVGMFSEESRDQVRKDRYDNCVQAAKNKVAAACSINACDVGCQIENMDNPLAITRCLNSCRESSPEEQRKLCEGAQSTVHWTAIQECPR